MLTASDAMDWRLYLSEVTAVLTETYSASTFAISALMLWPDRSHDAILFALLSRNALKIAHQPCVPRLLSRRLPMRDQMGRRHWALTLFKSKHSASERTRCSAEWC